MNMRNKTSNISVSLEFYSNCFNVFELHLGRHMFKYKRSHGHKLYLLYKGWSSASQCHTTAMDLTQNLRNFHVFITAITVSNSPRNYVDRDDNILPCKTQDEDHK